MAEHEDLHKDKPLAGVILCCTSIPPDERSDLTTRASQMGAIHKLDLTSDVTHLVVGDTDTPKYKFAAKKRPDVKCLLPSWVDAVRQSWLSGEETEVEPLEAKHRLPTFYRLRICLTGFEDLTYRKELEDLINDNGGEYRANLNKDVTHLIAKTPSGHKYLFAGEWEIKTVSIEWLTQSLERGMILDEKLFHPLIPEAERGRNAWLQKSPSSTVLGKRARSKDDFPNAPRRLRRTTSARLSSQSVGLWTDIVNTEVKQPVSKSEWDDDQENKARSIDHDGAKPATAENGSVVKESDIPEAYRIEANPKPSLANLWRSKGIFQDKRFVIHGFTERQTIVLQGHLRSHNAELIQDIEQLSPSCANENGYLLVPQGIAFNDIPNAPQGAKQPVVVTDMWIERCLHRKEIVDPKANVTSYPFPKSPISGFENLTICSTSFKDVDLLHLFKSTKLIGAKYDEFMTPNASVLICNASRPGPEKLHYAVQWKIPVVAAEWLWVCISAAELKPYDPYLIHPTKTNHFGKKLYPAETSHTDKEGSNERSLQNRTDNANAHPHQRSTQKAPGNATFAHISQNEETFQQENSQRTVTETCCPSNETVKVDQMTQESIEPKDRSPQMDFSQLLPQATQPLHEISVNSSPKHRLSPTNTCSVQVAEIPQAVKGANENHLGPAISSLLAHHQRSSTTNSAFVPSDVPKTGHRRRRLLGRAPSNLSARSNGSIGMSRASSVDTMNTDGLGTPLESSNPTTTKETRGSFSAIRHFPPDEGRKDEADDYLQMTQLGYEDPRVEVWRASVMEKLGGGMAAPNGVRDGMEKKMESIGVLKDVVGRNVQGIARRTRQALGK